MPRREDHARRRAEIVEAALRVVGRAGLDGATTRAIADEARCTLSVLAHYFGDKEGLLVAAQTTLYDRIVERAFRTGGELMGLAALEAALEATLPFDAERAEDAVANAAFAAAALSHPRLADARRRARQDIRRVLYGCLAEARAADELRDGVDDGAVVQEFFVLAEGAALQAGLDHDDPAVTGRVAAQAAAYVAGLRRA